MRAKKSIKISDQFEKWTLSTLGVDKNKPMSNFFLKFQISQESYKKIFSVLFSVLYS